MELKSLLEAGDDYAGISPIKDRLIGRDEFLSLFQKETRNLKERLSIPYLFTLADTNGIAIDYCGSDSLRDHFERNNFKIGTSWARQNAGINAISLSMEHQSIAVATGVEHNNKLLCSTPVATAID